MACGPCADRRKMITEAYVKSGVKGVAKTLPKVMKHLARRGKK